MVKPSSVISTGDLAINLKKRQVKKDGAPLRLTAMEFDLLAVLAVHIDQPVGKAEVLGALYPGKDDPYGPSLDVILSRLRGKLDPRRRKYIVTVRGKGYMLVKHAVPPTPT